MVNSVTDCIKVLESVIAKFDLFDESLLRLYSDINSNVDACKGELSACYGVCDEFYNKRKDYIEQGCCSEMLDTLTTMCGHKFVLYNNMDRIKITDDNINNQSKEFKDLSIKLEEVINYLKGCSEMEVNKID